LASCQSNERISEQESGVILRPPQQPHQQAVEAVSPLVPQSGVAYTATNTAAANLAQYTGYTAYGTGVSPFEVTYDVETWTLEDDLSDDSPNPKHWLTSKQIPDCQLILREGPRQYVRVSERQLAGRNWIIWIVGPNRPDYLIYSTSIENYAALFGVHLPAGVSEKTREECRRLAEEVLSTFRVVSP
jgi:hypothetical protein